MTFKLKIVTPDGLVYDGEAESIKVRTTEGDVGILPNHINYFAALGMGAADVKIDGQIKKGACIGGMISVANGDVNLVATSFEWADKIDVERAKKSEQRAKDILENKAKVSDNDIKLAEARLKRSLVRQSVARLK